MKPLAHFLASLVLAVLLYPVFNWKTLLILAGGVLIDIDHYLWYIYKYKKFNIFESYRFFSKNMDDNDFSSVSGILLLFHTIEFLLIMAILSAFFELALLFTVGLVFHYALDLVYLYKVAGRFIVNHSIIHWVLKNQQKV